jgi:ABC-type branched-subunit amino acid transport system substrate-binding protein
MADRIHAAERTRQAIEAAEDGQVDDARSLLAEALSLDPDYQLAWMWFAAVTDDEREEKYCLERARDLDPLRRPAAALARLDGVTPAAPPELRPITDPPPPDFIIDYAAQARTARRRRIRIRALVALAVVAAIVAASALVAANRVSYTYLALVVGDRAAGQQGGLEAIAAAEAAVASWNDNEATPEQQVRLVVFDDGDDPTRAEAVAREIVADGRFVGVIGHGLSSTSIAAGPVYRDAGIPVITPSATSDLVTQDNDWFFRTIFDNTAQGEGMALYAYGVHGATRAAIVSTDDEYAASLRAGFVSTFDRLGSVSADVVIPADGVAAETSDTVDQLVAAGADALVLASLDSAVAGIVTDLRSRGVDIPVIASDSLDTESFFASIATSPGALAATVSATPLTPGTLGGEAVTLYEDLRRRLGWSPGWYAGVVHDAADALIQALDRGDGSWQATEVVQARTAIRDELSAARTPATALPVLTGPLWFTPANAAARPVAFDAGRLDNDGSVVLTSAPAQVDVISAGVDAPEGATFEALGQRYALQQVVLVGVNINQVDSLVPSAQTFAADLFVWLKYQGDRAAAIDVELVNAVGDGSLGEPERTSLVDGERYELFRTRTTFRAQLEFSSFPFDRQTLPIVLQNRTLPSTLVTYIPDPVNLAQSQEERLRSGVDADETIDQIPNWQPASVQFFPQSVGNTGALGDPGLAVSDQGVTYSQFVAATTISRDVSSFLAKNLLPLVLLTLVTYVSLWYSHKDTTARVSFGVTGILTGAVMLNNVTSSLPQVAYTVAIEWAYYAFIVLSGLTIVVTLVGRKWTDERQLAKVRTLDRFMRIAYPVYVALVVLGYVVAFR